MWNVYEIDFSIKFIDIKYILKILKFSMMLLEAIYSRIYTMNDE